MRVIQFQEKQAYLFITELSVKKQIHLKKKNVALYIFLCVKVPDALQPQ